MQQTIGTLKNYITCDNPVVVGKYHNILDSFWHKSEGQVLKKFTNTATHFVFEFSTDTINIPKLGALEVSDIEGLTEALEALDVDCIPLTGTEPTNPVTGDIIVNNPDEASKGIHSGNYRPENYESSTYVQKKYVDDAIAVEQEIPVGGIYNDMDLEGNILVFTNRNAQAVIRGFNYQGKYKVIYLINNGNFPVRLDNNDGGSMVENQIQLPNNDVSVGLQGTSKLVYVETIQKWQLLDTYGSRYMPEHANLTQDAAITVGLNSISKSREIINPKVIREDISVAQTEANLNTQYPEVPATFQVICPAISKKYTKYSDLEDKWYEETLTTL